MKSRKNKKSGLSLSLTGYMLVLPSMVVFFIFFIYPIIYSLYLGFYSWNLLSPARFIGLANYHDLFTSEYFLETLKNSVNYSVGVLILAMVLGLLLALALNNPGKLSTLFQTCIFSSYIVSWVAIALLWIWMLDPQYGLINFIMNLVRLPSIDWLGNYKMALFSLILVSVWKIVGYPMIIFLAGLGAIPKEYYEAAQIDGAGTWHRFRYITWPLLSPISLFLLITLMINFFEAFDIVNIMTQGGPVHASTIYVYYIYDLTFRHAMKIGKASAAVVIFFSIILGLALLQYRVLRRKVQYL